MLTNATIYNMEPELEPMTDEEYYQTSNDISMRIAEIGCSFTDKKNATYQKITEILNGISELTDFKKLYDELYDLFFAEQLNTYIEGASYLVNSFKAHVDSNKMNLKVALLDDVISGNEDSQEMIIDSCLLFNELMFEIINTVDFDEFVGSIELTEEVRSAIGVYYETSFILGLTDAKSVNYLANHEGGTPSAAEVILEAIFPKLS